MARGNNLWSGRRHRERQRNVPSYIFICQFQTVAALETFVLAMTLNPGVLHKAQKEIDSVIGRDRLPVFSDLPSLAYVEAIMKETLRWNAIIHMGDYAPLPAQT